MNPPIQYPEQILSQSQETALETKLDLTRTELEIAYANIDQLPNEQYAMIRKDGLGTSDSSCVLGVNPYKTRAELIAEKCRNYLTEEELAVKNETAVRKGLDLEPLVMKKVSEQLQMPTYKPVDMYRHKLYPYLAFNFDGVTDINKQYIPVEIKIITAKGIRHYALQKATYQEGITKRPIPQDFSQSNNSIQTKAGQYGIPPYYYTQLQQQILGLNAPFGYLATLVETTWKLHVFFIWKDTKCITDLIIQGNKVWEQIELRKHK